MKRAWNQWSTAQKVVAVLFGWHPVQNLVFLWLDWNNPLPGASVRYIGSAIVWTFVTIVAIGIAGIFTKGAEAIKEEIAAGQRRYEQMPEKKQVELDRSTAQAAKWGGAALAGVFSLAVFAINPWAWGGAVVAGRAAIRNWREQNETIDELDAKRAKAIRS